MKTDTPTTLADPVKTMFEVMRDLGHIEDITPPDALPINQAHLVDVPSHRKVEDLTSYHRQAMEYLKPYRRRGTAALADLQSLIDWTNRFKGETSALFAKGNMENPSITCIADYHAAGPVQPLETTGDPTARHCAHRAVYNFPLSDEWKAWVNVSGEAMTKDQMGEFIEANAKDIMDPTPAILKLQESDKNSDWENRLIAVAQKIEGRYGQLSQLLSMSRHFQVYETSNLSVTTNRDTGEQEIQFLNEHKAKDGKPLAVPNLIIIAIPVFRNGAAYRMPVRFRYRKSGGELRFILSIYNPEKAFDAAMGEAVDHAAEATGLPVFIGTPES